MKPFIDESEVFKPVGSSIKDDNDWPIFPLANVDIASRGGNPISLLFANEDNPLTVTGQINSLDRNERQHLIYSDARNVSITIENVYRFSYGQFESGEIAFWAPGKAGWFEITPSRKYRTVYKDMAEAINILYFIVDMFRETTRKQMRQTSPDTIFEKYAEDATHNCPNEKAARSLFIKHKDSLVKLMAQGKEDIRWKSTAIFKFLQSDPQEEISVDVDEITLTTPNAQADDASSDDNTAAHLARKGKSALRPASGMPSNKGASRGQAPPDVEVEEEDIEMQDALRFDHSPSRRRSQEDDISSRPVKRRRGRPPLHKPVPRPPSVTQQPQATPEHDKEADLSNPPLPLHERKKAAQKVPPKKLLDHRISIVDTPLPSFDANQPGDVWACSFDGCAHRIFGASSDQSKGLIEEHYKRHAQEAQAKIDLVYQEERPYLPVGNLIQKIKDMAAAHQDAPQSVNKDTPLQQELANFPRPIEYKL